MQNRAYKIQHIPSGLFIIPNRSEDGYTTLSETGKIYNSPSIWKKFLNGNLVYEITISDDSKIYKKYSKLFPGNVKEVRNWNPGIAFKNSAEASSILIECIDQQDMSKYEDYAKISDNYIADPFEFKGYKLSFDLNINDFRQVFI